jgi:hypothetical protein
MIKWPKVHFQETYRIKSGIGIVCIILLFWCVLQLDACAIYAGQPL